MEDNTEYDEEKIDEIVLALLCVTMFKDNFGFRAWKGHNWDSLDRLHDKGYISNPARQGQVRGHDGRRRQACPRAIQEALCKGELMSIDFV